MPKLSTLCEFCDVMACQVTPYKQSTKPRLSLSCSTHAVHGAATFQPVTGNDAFLRHSKRWGFCTPDLPPFDDLIKAQEDQFFFTINHNPQHLLHYHQHRQLLLKATTSGTELITDHYPIVLDISWIQTLFRE